MTHHILSNVGKICCTRSFVSMFALKHHMGPNGGQSTGHFLNDHSLAFIIMSRFLHSNDPCTGIGLGFCILEMSGS